MPKTDTIPNDDQEDNPTPVGAIGVGYNTFYDKAMNSVINPATSGPVQGTFEPMVHVCTSKQDIMNALEIDASVAVNSPWGSFKDRFEFMSLLQITTTTVIILVEATMKTTTTVTGETFNDSYTDPLALYNQGGDSYVSSITSGGQYLAAYSYRAYDEETFESIVNSAEATFSGFSSKFSASFDAEITNISTTTQVTSDFYQKAIGFTTTPLPDTPEKLIPFVFGFNTVPLDAPKVLDFATTCYTGVADCPSGFAQVKTYLQQYTEQPSMLVDIDYMAKSNLGIISNVATIYDNYSMRSADPTFDDHITATTAIRNSIAVWRQSVDADPTKPGVTLPSIDTSQLVIPVAQYSLVPGSNAKEPTTGVAWHDTNMEDVQRGVLPSTISITADDPTKQPDNWITQLTTTYTTKDPQDPQFVKTAGFGNTGVGYPLIQLGPGEVITQVGVSWTTWTNIIEITTDRQGTITCGSGTTPLQLWTPPQNGCFVGWAGRGGVVVDALWPVWAVFYPAAWGPNPPDISDRTKKALPSKDMPTVDDILIITAQWAISAYPILQQIYPQKGGWEGWMQVEIARLLTQSFPKAIVLREQSVWEGSNERVDLFVKLDGPVQIVELKCESQYQDTGSGTYKSYVRAMKKDIAKIVVNWDALNPACKPANLLVIGFTFQPAVTDYANISTSWIPYGPDIKHAECLPATGTVPALWIHYVSYGVSSQGITAMTPELPAF